jgi:hypothetical protein
MDNVEDFAQRLSNRIGFPTAQSFRDRIQKLNATLSIGCNDRVTNAVQDI